MLGEKKIRAQKSNPRGQRFSSASDMAPVSHSLVGSARSARRVGSLRPGRLRKAPARRVSRPQDNAGEKSLPSASVLFSSRVQIPSLIKERHDAKALPRLAESEETPSGDAFAPVEGRGLCMSQVSHLVLTILRPPAPACHRGGIVLLSSCPQERHPGPEQRPEACCPFYAAHIPLGSGPGFGRTSGRCGTRRRGLAVTRAGAGPKLPSTVCVA